jgi:hypothetical protein
MSEKVDRWICPVCEHTEDADTPHVPKRSPDGFEHTCSSCLIHRGEEVGMEALE